MIVYDSQTIYRIYSKCPNFPLKAEDYFCKLEKLLTLSSDTIEEFFGSDPLFKPSKEAVGNITYIHTVHTYIHTYIHTYNILTYSTYSYCICILACIHTLHTKYIQYIHSYTIQYILICIHMYITS